MNRHDDEPIKPPRTSQRYAAPGTKPRAKAPGPQSIKSSPFIGVSLVSGRPGVWVSGYAESSWSFGTGVGVDMPCSF